MQNDFLPAAASVDGCSRHVCVNDAPADDSKILSLAESFRSAWKLEKAVSDDLSEEDYEAAYDAAENRIAAIVDEMIRTPAKTLAGLRAKAEALNWCHGDNFEGITRKPGDIRLSQTALDMRLADSILFDLLAINAA